VGGLASGTRPLAARISSSRAAAGGVVGTTRVGEVIELLVGVAGGRAGGGRGGGGGAGTSGGGGGETARPLDTRRRSNEPSPCSVSTTLTELAKLHRLSASSRMSEGMHSWNSVRSVRRWGDPTISLD